MDAVTRRIKEKAIELGFCGVGVAPVDRLELEGVRLKEWLDRGYHGTMGWMAKNIEQRIDPRSIMPEARSVVTVAMNYYTEVEHSQDRDRGKISRYAWGDDYHDVVKERLEHLLAFICNVIPDAKGKVYVDTGPVLEKVWAQRAGLGWEGKHTNVITRTHGSWVFLGEIILDTVLTFDAPAADHCGSCTLCIEACPTQAIVEPYVLDSNRCISYLTIEHKGGIPEELAEKFDNWIYGCDICQDVCPWNKKFAKPTIVEEFYPRPSNVAPLLEEAAVIRPEEFSQQFRKSPVKRTKRAGFVRNVSAVMQRNDTSMANP